MDRDNQSKLTTSSPPWDRTPKPTAHIIRKTLRFYAEDVTEPSPTSSEQRESQMENSEEVVDQLTAVGLIIFELIEATEDTLPSACTQLREAATSLIALIESVVIEEYLDTGTIIPVPRFNVDVSHAPGYELEDLKRLGDYLNAISTSLPPGQAMSCNGIRESVHLARLFVLQSLRPSIRSSATPQDPWNYLEQTLNPDDGT